MSFKKRTTKPEKGNKYYIRKESGGWSPAIQGSPTDPDCNVLSNCVGYVIGRFHEIGGCGCCDKYLKSVNAENFAQFKGNLESGATPKVGAVMVWQSGPTLSGVDGCGHVAIVEEVISDTEVLTSESAWGGTAFRNVARKKGSDGRWGMGSNYKFLEFIYNPAPCCKEAGTATAATTAAASNVIYKSLGIAAIRQKADTSGEPVGRCVKDGYYAASQVVTPAAGTQQWFRHAGTDLYSALTDTPAGGGAVLFEKYGTYTVGKTTDCVNVRTEAGTDKKIITALPKGTEVYLTGKTALASGMTWAQVVHDGQLAWMAKQYITC